MAWRKFHRLTLFGRAPVSGPMNLWLNLAHWLGLLR